jgi:hypothetical protein
VLEEFGRLSESGQGKVPIEAALTSGVLACVIDSDGRSFRAEQVDEWLQNDFRRLRPLERPGWTSGSRAIFSADSVLINMPSSSALNEYGK